MSEPEEEKGLPTFWEHLDELRHCLLRAFGVTLLCGLSAFFFKDDLFAVVLAPKDCDFVTYRWLNRLSACVSGEALPLSAFSVRLVNTELASQFVIHMKTALYAGVLCASPYLLYLLFRFVSPALYVNERRYAVRMVGAGYVMFMLGTALNYLLIFPLTFRFLGTYQVSTEVENTITLQSYMDTLLMMNLMMGVVFEIPVLCWLLARIGMLRAGFMRHYRRHAIVLILVVAAVITPTSDVFTLLLVSMPMWLLYEVSIFVVSAVNGSKSISR